MLALKYVETSNIEVICVCFTGSHAYYSIHGKNGNGKNNHGKNDHGKNGNGKLGNRLPQTQDDDEFRNFVGMLDGIAFLFLPVADMTTGLSWLKSIVPEDGRSLLQYFAETYVEGVSHPVGSSGQRNLHRSCGMSTYHFD